MNRYLLDTYAVEDLDKCAWKNIPKIEEIYNRKNLKLDFWKHSLNQLNLEAYQVDYKQGQCPWHSKKFKNHMWLPTSKQLRELWGLKFKGSICADNFEECKKKIDHRWKEGLHIVVGDEVYTSKGRK